MKHALRLLLVFLLIVELLQTASGTIWCESSVRSVTTLTVAKTQPFTSSGHKLSSSLPPNFIDSARHTACPDEAWVDLSCMEHASNTSSTWTKPAVWMNVTNPASYLGAAIHNDTTYLGPHVTFRANWSQLFIPDFPTVQIRQTRLEILTVVEQEHYGTIYGPVVGGWHPDLNPREAYDYFFCEKGDFVYVEVEFGTWVDPIDPAKGLIHGSSDDLDIFVWAPGAEQTYANSLTGSYVITSANPERGTFLAPLTGNYTIGIDYYSGVVPMGWRCYVYIYHADSVTMDGLASEFDTSSLGTNLRVDVRAVFLTGTSLDTGDIIDNSVGVPRVTVINFFPPTVEMIYPRGDERIGVGPIVIRWNGSDVNVEETLHYAVDFSGDCGGTWQQLTDDTTNEEYTWDSRAYFSQHRFSSFCLIRVTATDGKFTANATSYPFTIVGPHPPPGIGWDLILTGVLIVTATILASLTISFVLPRRQRRRQSSLKLDEI